MSWKDAIGMAAGGVIGQMFAKKNDRRQISQAKKLMALESNNNKELAQYNQGLAMDMWNNTNYGAQRKHIEDAGLNVGLMYGSAGQGGSTAGAGSADSVKAGQAPAGGGEYVAGMGIGLQAALQQAQIENIRANTENTKADTQKKSGVDTDIVTTEMDKLKAETKNIELNKEILEYEKEIKRIESEISNKTIDEVIRQLIAINNKLEADGRKSATDANIAEQTQDEIIKQIQTATTEQTLRIATQKAGLIKTGAETNSINKGIAKMSAEIVNMSANREIKWTEIEQSEKERWVKEKLAAIQQQQTDFNTSTAAQIQQWTRIIDDIAGSIGSLTPKGKK